MSAARECVVCEGEVFDSNENLCADCLWLEAGERPPVPTPEPSEINRSAQQPKTQVAEAKSA